MWKIKQYLSRQKGFTLIELMVSISLFSVVMLISMGAILTVVDSNRKSQALRAVMDNLNFALEGMTRNIRFGDNYHCGPSGNISVPNDCPAGGSVLTLRTPDGNLTTYGLVNNRIVKTVNGTDYYVTSPDITVQKMVFYVVGSYPFAIANPSTDVSQPKVLLVISGYSGNKPNIKSTFSLETTLSQRKFDY
jgi:prepilin-type N-terminal cleavage/methylation domain-containing protein